MTGETGNRCPPDGPPPVYVRPGACPPVGVPLERVPPARGASDKVQPVGVAPDNVAPDRPLVASGAAPAVPLRADASQSRAARNRARRSRRRGLLRLAVVGAVILAGIIVAVVLAATGDKVVPVISEQMYPIRYVEDIALVAETYDLDPYLVAAVAQTESGYNPEAVSPAGAVGLMQVMPDTATWITGLDSWQGGADPVLTDPVDSLELGACYLRYLTDRFEDRIRLVLAAYNAGQGAVGDWIEAAGGPDSFELTDIPYSETRDFVRRVEHYWNLYMRIYPDVFSGMEVGHDSEHATTVGLT